MNKLLSGNNTINDRVVLSQMVDARGVLVKQQTDKRRLWSSDTIYTNVCVLLEQMPISECCNYISDCMVSRSVERLPLIGEGIYQYAISGVYNVNINKKLTEITIDRWINLKNLSKQTPTTYYWIYDGYLYTTNPDLESVKLSAFFVEHTLPNTLLYPECGCDLVKYGLDVLCSNPLDRDFKIPGYLADPMKKMVEAQLLQQYFNVPKQKFDSGTDQQSKESQNPQ